LPARRKSTRKIKEVLRLSSELKLEQRQIARSCSLSVSTVHEYLKRAAATNIGWPLPDGWDDARLAAALFPPPDAPPRPTARKSPPDFAAIHEQLQRHRHVTLQLVWEEYRDANQDGYGYSRFCELYQRWRKKLDVVLRQEHKAGEKAFVDWAGATMPIYDRDTGNVWQASLFIATLGASSYTWAEVTRDQQMESWLLAHMHALEHWGGVPLLVVPDNTRTGVSKSCRYDPDVNPTYQNFAAHYGFGVLPARPYKPRDKAYVSYCTLSGASSAESWLLGPPASLALENSILVQRFVQAAPDIIVKVLFQQPISSPSVDCSSRHTVPYAHLFGREQPLGAQSAIATLQIEGLPDMRDLFQVERLILPGSPSLSIQNFCDLAITVMLQQRVDLGDHLRLRLSNLRDRQGLGESETSGGAAAETHVGLDRFSVD
jgi:transposase